MLNAGWIRDCIVAEIVSAGVPRYQGSCSEMYLEKAFSNSGCAETAIAVGPGAARNKLDVSGTSDVDNY
jgi:hypothetical protein